MDNTGALFSVLFGLLCAGAGILARPKSTTAADRSRVVLTGVAAAVPVLGWILWLGHPLATGLAFVLGTLVAGQLRDQTVSSRTSRAALEQTETVPLTELRLPGKAEGPTTIADPTALAVLIDAAVLIDPAVLIDSAAPIDPTAPADPAEPGELTTVAP